MSFHISLKLEAHQDIFETIIWYESKRKGLGAEFYAEVEKVKSILSINADSFEIKYRNRVRWIPTDRFPYIVIYVINGNSVTILAVISTHRHPKIWKDRV